MSSKKVSTSAAQFVSNPKSNNSAPRDAIPPGILIAPDPTPAKKM